MSQGGLPNRILGVHAAALREPRTGGSVALRAVYVRAIFATSDGRACLVKVGQGNKGYRTIEEFLPDGAALN